MELTVSQERFERRRSRLRKALSKHKLDALLVIGEKNVSYLTGFSGDSTWLLLSQDDALLLSDFRYVTQIQEECPELTAFIRASHMTLVDGLREVVGSQWVARLGVEGHLMTMDVFNSVREKLTEIRLTSVNREVEELRAIKDADELQEIRTAVRLAERGFECLRSTLRPQATERQLAFELEHAIRSFGGAGLSFPAIVAVGDRAALPHYRPGDRDLSLSPILLVDWGATAHSGYRSDITRTLLTGKPPRRFEKVYRTVLEAQALAIERIRAGVTCREVDAAAREHIERAGFGRYFDHGTGHGIGLDVHELPRLSGNSETVLRPGMVVTVEPGIYLPGWGGVRIEDDVLVTRQGCEVLSSVPKDWDSVQVSYH